MSPRAATGKNVFLSLFANWQLKILALAVAITLHAVLHSGGDLKRTLEVDLSWAMEDDSTRVLLTPLPPRVLVTVQGPRVLLDDLGNPLTSVNLDLSTQPSSVRIAEHLPKLPPGVRLVAINPSAIGLRWDSRQIRNVNVEPTWNAVPEGMQLKPGSLVVIPRTVRVTGPRTRVDPIQKLLTASLDLRDRSVGMHTQRLYVDKAAEGLVDGMVDITPEQVDVRFELIPEVRTRTFTNVRVLLLRGRAALRPSEVTVLATCPPARADELKIDAVVPKIDLEALGPDFAKRGPEDAPVKVEIPGCSEVVATPAKVTVLR